MVILEYRALIIIIIIMRYFLNVAVNKADDAIRNARIRMKNAAAPPQKERLSDAYETKDKDYDFKS
jgi:hypothetical protein